MMCDELSLPPLVLRADASTQIGTGHVMRCLALAQAWQDVGGHAIFVMTTRTPVLEARLQSEGMEVVHLSAQPGSTDDAIQTAELAWEMCAPWVVVDGYHFDPAYQRQIKEAGHRLLVIDDKGHADHYYADVVLNQNLHAYEGLYESREPYTQLLLGPRYVLLRREFWKWRRRKRSIPKVARKVLVTLGGSDPNNVTLKAIKALQKVETQELDVVVVAGGSNPRYEQLQSAVQDSDLSIRLERSVRDMSELMVWADIAVSSGGTTVWELAFLGLPTIVGIAAPVEQLLVDGLKRLGLFACVGWFKNLSVSRLSEHLEKLIQDKETRKRMSLLGQQVVDGNGCDRVLSSMIECEKLADAN